MLCHVLIFNLRCGAYHIEQQSPIVSWIPSIICKFLFLMSTVGQGLASLSVAVTIIVTMSVTLCSNKKKLLCSSVFLQRHVLFQANTTKLSRLFECYPKCVLYLWGTIRKYGVNVTIIILMHNGFLVVRTENSLNYEYYLWLELFNNVWEI